VIEHDRKEERSRDRVDRGEQRGHALPAFELPPCFGKMTDKPMQAKAMNMNQTPDPAQQRRLFGFLRVPLFRLLAINLAAGVAIAALLVGGLLALDPGGLRHLIFADASPGTALGLLLFGFVVTIGSAAMGTAIMAMRRAADDKRRGPPAPVAQVEHAFIRARRG
jgi:hypothetical protein